MRPLVEAANKAVMVYINTSGPNLMLRLHNYVNKLSDSNIDTIGSLLKLVSSNGKRLLYTSLAVVEAMFDQQWQQVNLLSGLPAALAYAMVDPRVKGILNSIFTVAVPIINMKARKDEKTGNK